MPYDLRIQFIKKPEKEAFLKNNQVVIRMNNHTNPNKNIVYAITDYVNKCLIYKARQYVDTTVIKSADLVVTRKLILMGFEEALQYYLDNILEPQTSSNDDLRDLVAKLIKLDSSGMLTNVLFREFIEKASLLYPEPADECIKAESREFVTFLHNIASKSFGVDVSLVYVGNYFKVGIIIVAKDETYNKYGIQAYLSRITKNLDNGLETIYLFAKRYKSDILKEIEAALKSSDYRIRNVERTVYKHKDTNGRLVKGICVIIKTTEIIQDDEIEIIC